MAANPEVVEDTSTIVTYRLHDKPPLPVTALLGLQHTLAMFVGNITPPIIVAAALGFDVMTTAFIISMTLFTAGLSTWIQAKKIGRGIASLIATHILASSDYTAIFAISLADLYP